MRRRPALCRVKRPGCGLEPRVILESGVLKTSRFPKLQLRIFPPVNASRNETFHQIKKQVVRLITKFLLLCHDNPVILQACPQKTTCGKKYEHDDIQKKTSLVANGAVHYSRSLPADVSSAASACS